VKLPSPSPSYDQSRESERNRLIERADQQSHKRGQDLFVSPGRLIITSPNGELNSVQVNNTAQVQTAGDPEYMLQTAVYGQLFYQGPGTVTISTTGTYVVASFSGTLDTTISEGIALSASNLGIKNVSGRIVRVPVYASVDGKAGNNQALGLKLALNGSIVDQTECRSATGSSADFAKLVTRWIFQLNPDDEVTVAVANHSATTDITIDRARVIVA